ncbi:hypothetical protein [Phycisphaera mikurensis]|uniref:TonB C-terminal domain-containing protein n=1 Tax=Phycisphaera mikurensis (strain NBRC 102666 / KCTC 22515 / FYK2301M01) TaxID=1142394 RepID=I0IHJ3_PHYMF|nr:hypothetical protein [Phycisphaera mikurensis]MBB6440975.1 TonB family protein [Phycisphaera mikurensis]BAM04731.1 hypothetical protein PSMK_25720 [Phycisphaera mikurensis NBRC 102666]
MIAGGRLLLALALAVGLHALALAAAAAWAPAPPALPPVGVSLRVADVEPGGPALVRFTARAAGGRASLAASATGQLTPPGGGPPVPFRIDLPPIPAGGQTQAEARVRLPADAAGPWSASLALGNAGPLRAAFWVDDGRPGDLAIAGLDAGGTTAAAGGAVRVAWQRENRGAGWLRGGGRDAVAVLAGDAPPLAAAAARGSGPLPPGGRSARTLVLPLPAEAAGVVRLRVEVDAGRVLAEPHGPENAAELPLLIEASPYPDLAAARLDVGEAATLASAPPGGRADRPVTLVAGSPAPVRLVVENLRPAAAGPARRDAVYLSTDDRLSPDDTLLFAAEAPGPLPGGASAAAAGEASIPEGFAPSGGGARAAFLLGVADADGEVDEGDPGAGSRRNNLTATEVRVVAGDADAPDTPLGRDGAEPRVTVAWIAHDAFEDLLARRRRTLQPALQASAAPTPGAPARDATAPPTPPAPPASAPAAAPLGPEPAAIAPAGEPAAEGVALPGPGPADAAASPDAATAEDPRTAAESAGRAPPSADPADPGSAADPPTPPEPPPAPEGPPEPTSAPRSDSESDATAAEDATELRPGRVEVGPGLTVDVARPKIDPVAILSTVVRSPRVAVTFDRDGTVLNARILRSAGSNAVDAPILRSLYRWRASGERLDGWDAPRTFEFTFLLSR